jgi:hypothetical protein
MRISQDSYDFEFVRRVQVRCAPDFDLASGGHTQRRDCPSRANRGSGTASERGTADPYASARRPHCNAAGRLAPVRTLRMGKRPRARRPLRPRFRQTKLQNHAGRQAVVKSAGPAFGLSSGNAVSPETGLVNQVKSQNRRIDPNKSSTRSYGLIIATASSGQEICSRSCRTDISSLSRARNHHDQGED